MDTLLQDLRYGTRTARDPWVFASVALLVAVAALGACLVPGRRALKVDPLLALRAD